MGEQREGPIKLSHSQNAKAVPLPGRCRCNPAAASLHAAQAETAVAAAFVAGAAAFVAGAASVVFGIAILIAGGGSRAGSGSSDGIGNGSNCVDCGYGVGCVTSGGTGSGSCNWLW